MSLARPKAKPCSLCGKCTKVHKVTVHVRYMRVGWLRRHRFCADCAPTILNGVADCITVYQMWRQNPLAEHSTAPTRVNGASGGRASAANH
jgi:hypothetical protein